MQVEVELAVGRAGSPFFMEDGGGLVEFDPGADDVEGVLRTVRGFADGSGGVCGAAERAGVERNKVEAIVADAECGCSVGQIEIADGEGGGVDSSVENRPGRSGAFDSGEDGLDELAVLVVAE